MNDGLTRLIELIDALESDVSWPWPPIDRSVPSKKEKVTMKRFPHDPSDLYLADRVYTQFLTTTRDENLARERVYKHLVVSLQWSDDRAQHASSLASEIE